jgi:hypothetical protein
MKTMMKISFLFAFFLIGTYVFAQQYKTGLSLKKGDVYTYSLEAVVESRQQVGDMDISVLSNSKATIKDSVTRIFRDGSVEIIASFWDFSSTASSVGGESTTNLDGLVGSPVKIVFDRNGKPQSRIVIDPELDATSGADLDTRILLENIICEFPAATVKTGKKWTVEHNDSLPQSYGGYLNISSVSEYTMGEKDEKKMFPVGYISKMEINGTGIVQGMNMTIDGVGAGNGELIIDPANGIVSGMSGNTDLVMSIEVTGPEPVTIPITQKVKTTITRLD